MKKSILLGLVVILLCSCNSREVNFRAKELRVSNLTFDMYLSSEITLIKVDSAFRVGDTVVAGGTTRYLILEKVK